MFSVGDCKLINLPKIKSGAGNITVLENFKDNDAIFKLIDTFKKKAMEVVK